MAVYRTARQHIVWFIPDPTLTACTLGCASASLRMIFGIIAALPRWRILQGRVLIGVLLPADATIIGTDTAVAVVFQAGQPGRGGVATAGSPSTVKQRCGLGMLETALLMVLMLLASDN